MDDTKCPTYDRYRREEIESMKKDIHQIQMAIVKIETRLQHTLENKHAEAISVARAIDVKFKWVSLTIGIVASIGVISSLLSTFK